MTTLPIINPNEQALNLKVTFQRKAQLLHKIYEKQVAIQHYVPEVKETFIGDQGISAIHTQYRHFSYFIAPLRDRLFEGRYTGTNVETGLNECAGKIITQLTDHYSSIAFDDEANEEAIRLVKSYEECARFLSLICQEGVAITDYIPKIKIRPDAKTGNTYYSVSYQHRYLLPREKENKVFIFESSAIGLSTPLQDCMAQVVSQLKANRRQM